MKKIWSFKFTKPAIGRKLFLLIGLMLLGFSLMAQQGYSSLTEVWESGKLPTTEKMQQIAENPMDYKGEKPEKVDLEKDISVIYWFDEFSFFSANECNFASQDFSIDQDYGIEGFDGPLNSDENYSSGVGPIVPGINFVPIEPGIGPRVGPGSNGMVSVGPSAGFGNTNNVVLANFFVDEFNIYFDPAVTTAGMEVSTLLGSGIVSLVLYDAGGGIIDVVTGFDAFPSGFFGFYSDVPVARVSIFDQGGGAEGISKLMFCGGTPCQTYSAQTPVPLNDAFFDFEIFETVPGLTTATLMVPNSGIIGADFQLDNLFLNIEHTWVGDLEVRLTSPEGTIVSVFERPGIPFLPGSFGCSGDNIVAKFYDAAPNTATDFDNTCGDMPAIAGDFQPLGPFSAFNGENAQGIWTLTIIDNAGGDTGALLNFDLTLCGVTGCDDAAEGPMLETPCPDNIELCGPQMVFWQPPTATDNCVDPFVNSTHDPGDFFDVGTTTVTYTFEDGVGQQVSCSFDITINPLPMVGISPADVPEWCQGVKVLISKVFNTGDLAEPITYLWNTGETTPDILVTANDTYSLVVTDGNGCEGYASILVDEDLSALLSAHTILVEEALDMDYSLVLSGGVGVQDANEVSIQNSSDITTFLRSAQASVDGSSAINDYIPFDSPVEFPEFISNPFNDTNDEMVAGTGTLTESNYGNVYVKSGATLIIDNPEMYMKSLTVQKGASVYFNEPGILVIRQKLNVGSMCNINVEGPGVVVYVGDNAEIGQGSVVAVDIYAPEGLDVSDSGAFMTTYMYGLFITDELNSGDDVVWGWNLICGESEEDEEPCAGELVNIFIQLDNFPNETSWQLVNEGGIVAEGGTYGDLEDGSIIDLDLCLDPGCYEFTIFDSFGDGICCTFGEGFYEVTWGDLVLAAGGDFDSEEATFFCVGIPFNSASVEQDPTAEPKDRGFTVFPNPTEGMLNINVLDFMGSEIDIRITNLMGQKVWVQHIDVLETSIIPVELSDNRYPSGLYNVTLYVNGEVLTKQIILNK